MDYVAFKNKVLLGVKDFMGEEVRVECSSVLKNNGITLDGIVILEDIVNVSPTIYIHEFYEEYRKGKPISAIIYQIITLYEKHKVNQKVDIHFFKDFDQIQKKVVYKLVHYGKNKTLLESIPHLKFLDLAIVFYCVVMNDSFQNGSILIYNNHCELWKTDVQGLYKIAKENTPKLLPCELKNMECVIKEMFTQNLTKEFHLSVEKNLDEDVPFEITDEWIEEVAEQMIQSIKGDKKEIMMYVFTNSTKTFGAGCILYEGALRKIAEKLKEDLYILPSSIHEIIIIPAKDCIQGEKLKAMVRDVNECQVMDEEVLSDEIYYYSRAEDRIYIKKMGKNH